MNSMSHTSDCLVGIHSRLFLAMAICLRKVALSLQQQMSHGGRSQQVLAIIFPLSVNGLGANDLILAKEIILLANEIKRGLCEKN